MTHIQKTIETEAEPQTVFDFVTSIERRPEWQLHLKGVEKLTDGPVGVGTQFRDISKFGASTLEVSVFESPQRISYKNVGGPFDVEVKWHLTAVDASTRVDVDLSVAPRGLMKLMWPLLRRMAVPQIRKDFEELERALQSLEGGQET